MRLSLSLSLTPLSPRPTTRHNTPHMLYNTIPGKAAPKKKVKVALKRGKDAAALKKKPKKAVATAKKPKKAKKEKAAPAEKGALDMEMDSYFADNKK